GVRERPRHRPQGAEGGRAVPDRQFSRLCQLRLHRRHLPVLGKLASPNNPFADADGNIFVTPGKQIPGIPRHQVKGGVDYWFTPELKLGTASGSVANGLLATTPTRTRSSPTTGSRTCLVRADALS